MQNRSVPAESPDSSSRRRLRQLHVRRQREMHDELGTAGVLVFESSYGRPARAVRASRMSK